MDAWAPLGQSEMRVHANACAGAVLGGLDTAAIHGRGYGRGLALSTSKANAGQVLDRGWWFKEAYQLAIASQMVWRSGLKPPRPLRPKPARAPQQLAMVARVAAARQALGCWLYIPYGTAPT